MSGSDRQTADRIGRLRAMRTREDSVTVWVCEDCYCCHAGISEDERGEAYPDGTLALLADGELSAGLLASEHDTPCGSFDSPDGDFLGGDCECETRSFSWSPCEGCGSSLGGSRHALTLWFD